MNGVDAFIRGMGDLISDIRTKQREREIDRTNKPEDYTDTEAVLHDMLQENTGAHILDSGSAYGRHWERNRDIKDFRENPKVNVNIDAEYETVNITVDLFHYLNAFLEVTEDSEKLDIAFNQFAERDRNKDKNWLTLMEDFTQNRVTNTYNFDNHLSQVISYTTWDPEENKEYIGYHDFILLRIHNGCDVRGGYTKPRVFEFAQDPEYWTLRMTDQDAICKNCGATWYSDDAGYHWYEGPEFEFVESEPEDKVLCGECGGEVEFNVLLEV